MAKALPDPSPERFPVLSFEGIGADLFFWEKVNLKFQRNRDALIGTPHWDIVLYPNHKLVHKAPLDAAGQWHKFFYAADRENQDDYNWQFDGSSLTRTYVLPRETYLEGIGTLYGAEARATTVGVADETFGLYGFTHEEVQRAPKELESLYVILTRVFQQITKTKQFFDNELGVTVLETTQIVARGSMAASSAAGLVVEINPVNQFYDLKVTQAVGTITLSAGVPVITPLAYPFKRDSLPSDSSYQFPPLLRNVSIEAAWAYADSATAARAYDEAWYFKYELIEPAPGPYEARILRYLTGDPDELSILFTVDTPPATPREVIGISGWWAHASTKGNSAFAEAREEVIPSSIHERLEIDVNGIVALSNRLSTTVLEETPGFEEFSTRRSMIIGYEPRITRYGLYEIRIIELNTTGLYGGVKVPMGSVEGDGGSTGATIPSNNPKPEAPVAMISANNLTVSGTTYSNAAVTVVETATAAIVGRVTADINGDYSLLLTTEYLDAIGLTVTARYNGQTSYATALTTYDLTPFAPFASINSGGTTLTGITEAGATVNFTRPAIGTAQVESTAVTGSVTTGGDVIVTVTGVGITSSPLAINVAVVTGETNTDVAANIRSALGATTAVAALYTVGGSGTAITLTEIVLNGNDATLNVAIDGSTNGTGVTDTPFSTDHTLGIPFIPAVPVVLTANVNGAFSYTFSPALTAGNTLSITATDNGGTSPATVLTYNGAPPTITSATFATSTSITGFATALSVVRAYLVDGTEIGNDAADGSTAFSITLASSRIRGEVVRLVAESPSNATIRSGVTNVTAPDLNLAIPVLTYTTAGWIGTKPVGSTSIVYRLASGGVETTITPFANGNFAFSLPTYGGERYQVVARYAGGDSDPVYINAQDIPRAPIKTAFVATSNWPSNYFDDGTLGRYAYMNGYYGAVYKSGYSNWLIDAVKTGDNGIYFYVPYEALMTVQFTFPGQALNTVTHSPGASNFGTDYRYKVGVSPLNASPLTTTVLPTLMNIVATYADGRTVSASFDRAVLNYKYLERTLNQ